MLYRYVLHLLHFFVHLFGNDTTFPRVHWRFEMSKKATRIAQTNKFATR